MALDTYGGLKASVATWSSYTDLTAVIPDFVAWAHQEICARLRCSTMEAATDLTINAETIAQPTGFRAFRRLYLDVTPRRRILTTSTEGAMDLSFELATGQYPTHVAIEGLLLRFAPVFTATVTGKALYYKDPATLSADADTNVVLAKYPYLYLYGALEALFRYKEDDNNADRYGAQFGGLLESINALEAKDAMSGPLQSSPSAGAVA